MKLRLDPIKRILLSLMVDECKIYKGPNRQGAGVFNEATGTYTAPDEAMIYFGPCLVTAQTTVPYTRDSGGGQTTEIVSTVSIPLQDPAIDIMTNDVILITGIHPDGNEALLDEQLFVVSMSVDTYSVSHDIRAAAQMQIPA